MGNGNESEAQIARNVIQWARGKLGKKVGKGWCWDLAEEALKFAGAKTSRDLGEVKDDSDYVWGKPIQLKDIQPGDVLQLRDHLVLTEIVEEQYFSDGSSYTENRDYKAKRPHHTAIAVSLPNEAGEISTLEQFLKGERIVKSSTIRLRGQEPRVETVFELRNHPFKKNTKERAKIIRTTSVTVTGEVWAYRPQKKN